MLRYCLITHFVEKVFQLYIKEGINARYQINPNLTLIPSLYNYI